MGYKSAFAYCRHCGQKVLIICPAPSHLLHFALSLLSAGLWIPVWLFTIIRDSYHCRCCICLSPVRRGKAQFICPGPTISRPWQEAPFQGRRMKKGRDFNTGLIQNGLVWYASSRTAK